MNPTQLLFLLLVFTLTRQGVAVVSVHVGAILDLEKNSLVGKMCSVSLAMALEDFYAINGHYKTKVVLHTRNSREDVVEAASAAVDLIKNQRVEAIIGPLTSVQAAFVVEVGNRTKVPVVSFSASSPSLSPSRWPYFVRTTLNSSAVVDAIAAVAKTFGWREVVAIYEDTNYGIAFLPYLVDAFISVDTRVTKRSAISSSASDDQIVNALISLRNFRTRVFVVHMLPVLGSRLFLKAKEMGMMSDGYVWITTDVMTDMIGILNSTILEAMNGVIGVKPYIPDSEELGNFSSRWKTRFRREYPDDPTVSDCGSFVLWAYDTAWAMALAVENAGFHELSQQEMATYRNQTSTDLGSLVVSMNGPRLLSKLLKTTLNKLSGEFRLTDGQLQSSAFVVVNVVGGVSKEVGFWTLAEGVQPWLNSTSRNSREVQPRLREVVWPGGHGKIPKGWQLPVLGKKLNFAVPAKSGFKELVDISENNFKGYSIEVFDAVMKSLGYADTYFYTPKDAQGGNRSYDNLIDLIYGGEVDGVVGDFTIEANRSKYADFTLPYTESGVSMVVPIKEDRNKSPWVFLWPLAPNLWLGSMAFFVFTGFVVWTIERRINENFRGPASQQIGTTFYFAFSTMVYAHRERVESNLSRFVVTIWVFVVLILSSSYTASLTSMLTVQQLQPTVKDLNELLKDRSFVGYQDGSFVKDLLIRLKFEESKLIPLQNVTHYLDALSTGRVSAIVDEIPYLKIFLQGQCSRFAMIGPIFKTDGFGFAMARGSPLVPQISRAILNISEGNTLGNSSLTETPACKEERDIFYSRRLSLRSFSALFAITGGVSFGCLLLFFVFFLYNNWSEVWPEISRGSFRARISALGRYFDQKDNSSYDFKGANEEKKGCDCESRRPPEKTPLSGSGSQTPMSISDHSFMAHNTEEGRPSTSSEIEPAEHPVEESNNAISDHSFMAHNTEEGRPSTSSEIEPAEHPVEESNNAASSTIGKAGIFRRVPTSRSFVKIEIDS